MSGRSSGVEHNLAKVGVGRSNRLARSIIPSKQAGCARLVLAHVFRFRPSTYPNLRVALALSRITHMREAIV